MIYIRYNEKERLNKMKVVDIRSIFSKRNIELFDVGSSYIYYAEEKNEGGHNDLFILEYNRSTGKERLVTNYTLEDPTFVEHLYAFENTLILILENGGNSMWLIEIDKTKGTELNRRKIVCTGAFRSCIALDADHILIYMGPDEANAGMFSQYTEVTGCECLCYLYNLRTNIKHFVKSTLIAKLGVQGIRQMESHGEKYLVLLDPFADEDIKRGYYEEQRWINADIRDNIWLCELSKLELELEAGVENISKKCIASADIKALARYMGTDGDKMYFRAKEFRTGIEKICSYDLVTNSLGVEAELKLPEDRNTTYIVEEKPFAVFSVTKGEKETEVKGLVNSEAGISFENSLGAFMSCVENRYIICRAAEKSADGTDFLCGCSIYDSETDKSETYRCSCYLKGNTLVLY